MADFLDDPRFPTGLDEGDLIAWIEGEPCAAGKRAAIAAWLSREPQLARLVAAMRQDRAGVQSLEQASAPAGLVAGIADQVEPLMERQMLLGLSQGEDVHDHLPVSVVRPPRQSLLAAFFADSLGRRIAMAAAVLVMVGGSTYFIAQTLSGPGPGPGPVKHRIARSTEAPATGEQSTMAAAAPEEEAMSTMALKPEQAAPIEPSADATMAEASGLAADGSRSEMEAPAAMAMRSRSAIEAPVAEMGPFLPAEIDPARAVALAEEGRLIVRIRASDPALIIRPDRVLARLQRAQSPAWTVQGEAPQVLVSAVAQPFPADLEQRLPQLPREMAMAGVEPRTMRSPLEEYGPPLPTLRDAAAKGPTVYTVNTRLDTSALARLRQVIASAGGEVVFEESPAPLPGSQEPILTAQSILWWGQSPAGWTRWAQVPVVVDVAR